MVTRKHLPKPKKKNKKPIRIAYVESTIQGRMKQDIELGTMRDEEVKHFLKTFGGKNV